MSQPPADLDTDHQPPMALPFAHFVIGTVLLVLGGVIAGLGPLVISIRPDNAGIVHLLLVGWVALTIMGAMTLFVPVWSGTTLRSHRSAVGSLWLVVVGVLVLVWTLLARDYGWLPVGATVLLAGFWLFVSNVGRSLPRLRDLDVTEAHFVVALASLAIASLLGWLLAASIGGLRLPISIGDPSGLLLAHLTLTVFGFVLATIVGALYQLSEMFTQSPKNAIDEHLTHVEMVALPIGIATLAAGRYVGGRVLARLGATLLFLGTVCFGVFLLRRLWLARVSYGPMLKRYALVAASMIGWVLLSLPRWIADPLDYFARFGSPRGTHLLFVGIVAFTIVGTFYHVVPFVVWYNEYRDKLGVESVPMMEDLYEKRVAKIEFWLLTGGFLLLVGAEVFDAATWVRLVGGNVLGIGFLLFAANMAGVVIRHRPQTFEEIPSILAGRRQ